MKMSLKRFYLFSFVLFCSYHASFSQKDDSINVVFRAIGRGEKFSFYVDGKRLLKIKLVGEFVDTLFQISKTIPYKKGDAFNKIVVARKGKFGVVYRDTQIQIHFEEKSFLVIEKNPYLKNRIAIVYYWTNERPRSNRIRNILNPKE